MTISSDSIKAHLAAVAEGADTYEQGRAHEDLAVHLFDSVPGCRAERTSLNVFKSEEVDVVVWNDRVRTGLPGLANVILVGCKGWSRPLNSQAVGDFVNKLANRSVELGILIVTNAIAGREGNRYTVAAGIGPIARGRKLIVITKDDLMGLSSTADFVELVNRRYLRAVAAGTIGLPS